MSRRASRVDATASPRATSVRAYLHRWAEAAGAHVLVVDPSEDHDGLETAMAGRGVHVTWVGTTTEGLIEFGRLDPHVVVVAADSERGATLEFVTTVAERGTAYVVIGVCSDAAAEAGELMLLGAHAVVSRPYVPEELVDVLDRAPRALDDHACVRFGPIELDAGSYSVRVGESRIGDLPLKEFELLRALLLAAPEVVTDDALRAALWGPAGKRPSGNTIAMHVTRLRHRLEGTAAIRRIRGRGYSLTL
ncbi:winged helix-turn-helix domain-containing protein [Nocardioides panacisoli]|uniref:response regulator transcription factor n=1 Tax=Nocardioides panacisoli TaxID=627624 RepID=UPI001C6292DB|nr:winged helix-turn-helix domain-containing protein [Nocardioides panacisoli]QYJ03911.1 winged helix-turn-helix domain-containing protein [Nocardioides panacisoli]